MKATCGFMHRIIAMATAVCLAVSLLAAGYVACMAPIVSSALSNAFAQDDLSPYSKDDLVGLSLQIRDYTVCDYGRAQGGVQQARETLAEATLAAAERSSASSEKQDEWNAQALQAMQSPAWSANPAQAAEELSRISCRYALDPSALQHLDDCHALMNRARIALACIAIAGAASLAYLLATRRFRQAGQALFAGPLILAAFMLAAGAWCTVDFNGFFSLFHRILFPQGNWTFPADSLLICSLPLEFWMVMAAVWLAVTLFACIIAMILGRRLTKRRT